MAGKKQQSALVLIFVMTMVRVCSAATTHIVGDGVDWGIPSPPTLYSTWASNKIFQIGDILEFNFVNGVHTVAAVSKAAYDGCNTNDLLSPAMTTSPARVTLNTTGIHYFLCTTPNHCSLGQKFSVFVNGHSLSPTTSPSGPPPAGSFAAPTAAAVSLLSLVSVGVAAALLFYGH